jgi:hypothetical protein
MYRALDSCDAPRDRLLHSHGIDIIGHYSSGCTSFIPLPGH